ncbi:MAG TPA: hypothetical protein GXX19_02145 [Syntrophomonadaceae bacterium]|nr:hypothetical protein [Syntrophomonadaceae bacterium]
MNWRRKTVGLFLVVMFLLFCVITVAQPAGAQAVTPGVTLNGQRVYFPDVQPVNVNGRVLVPIRFIAESPAFGAVVTFEQSTCKVTVTRGSQTVVFQPDSRNVYVNGKLFTLDVAPILKSGRTLVPLRFLSETFGATVNWDASRNMVLIELKNGGQKIVLGYYFVGAYDEMLAQHGNLTDVAFHWYRADETGSLTQAYEIQNSRRAVEAAQKSNLRTQAGVALFDRQKLHLLLNSKEARSSLIGSIVDLVRREKFQAVNLDFESVAPEDRDAYNTFLAELSQALKQSQTGLMVAVPAKEREVSWLAAYDYGEIARYADQIVVMAYDQHYRTGTPGPIAPLDWVGRVISYAKQQVPAGKIILGLGIYGYDWPEGQPAKSLSYQEAENLAASRNVKVQWDPVACLPHFTYSDENGTVHQVWYENRYSLKAKLDLAANQGLAGVSIWRLGMGFPEFWNDLAVYKN